MTCPQCPKRIAKALRRLDGVGNVTVSLKTSDAVFDIDSSKIQLPEVIAAIGDIGYKASEKPSGAPLVKLLLSVGVTAALFAVLQVTGLLTLLAPSELADSGMGLGALFVVGLTTSLHCIAMCGGISLSQSVPTNKERKVSYSSAVLYNAGRVVSYTAIGAVLGAVGLLVGSAGGGISPLFQGIFKLTAGLLLVGMAARSLGLLPELNIRLPKFAAALAGKTAAMVGHHTEVPKTPHGSGDKRDFQRAWTPFIVGLLNGLMPCGPLQSMWLVALASGNPLTGALSMLVFTLGTVPLMLGFGSLVTLLGHRFTAAVQTAGTVLIAVMGLAMLTQGAGLTGMIPDSVLYAVMIGLALVAVCAALPIKQKAVRYGSMLAAAATAAISGFMLNSAVTNAIPEDTAIIADGVQLVSSTLKAGSYPEITVCSGIPVKWTINAPPKSINGCNGTFIINDLGIQYTFREGENVIEFTPGEAGVIDYTCWMGMIRSKIHVVSEI